MKLAPKNVASPETLRNQLSAIEQKLGPIAYRPIADLKPYANNPRKHPEKQITLLMSSISEFGFAMPVLIDGGDTIIAGELRTEGAKRLGMKKVPTITATHWSAAQVRAYRLADNRLTEHGTWDLKSLAIEIAGVIEIGEVPVEIMGWNTAEIDVILDGQIDDTETTARNDVADFGRTRMDDLAAHPTVKPVDLVADAIRDVSRHGDIVVDAFAGSGTIFLAAQRAGRVAFGIEIEPGYVDVSVMRWEAMTGQQAVLEATGQTFAEVAASRAPDRSVRKRCRRHCLIHLAGGERPPAITEEFPMPFITPEPHRATAAINPRRRIRATPLSEPNAGSAPAELHSPGYEVGYGRPPQKTQFKPGRSGNPRGRPKRAKGMKTITIDVLTEKVAIRTQKGTRRVSRMEAVLHKLLEKAFAGDVRAQQALIVYYTKYVTDESETQSPDQVAEALDLHDVAALEAFHELVRSELQSIDEVRP